jgi:hypothetical protein
MVRSGLLLVVLMSAVMMGVQAAAAEIKIATAGPMSGDHSWAGEQYQRGAGMAVADLNAKGGVLGQNVELIVGDDFCDPIRRWRSPANWSAMAWSLSPGICARTPRSRPRRSTKRQTSL